MAFDRLKHWLFGDPTSFRHSFPRTPQAAIREAIRQHRENVAWLEDEKTAAIDKWSRLDAEQHRSLQAIAELEKGLNHA